MTFQEADDLRLFLVNELIKHGFSTIVEEANKRMLEKFDEGNDADKNQYNPSPIKLLTDFLYETIQVFTDFSNENYGELIKKINKNLDGKEIDGIEVELVGQSELFNLSELPNYYEIYNMLGAVREDILRNK
ncbi:hypothetical protein [Flavobacterium piscisymbiosum]|uniref:Uncharacterized protein n=1 Tax=Flavobacterium piscisymbiosum TaxID=2893753 RepID=A0ABS8MDN0_9FLAO|nr:hypothetical protein [Flavobacterium sp. F-30]MCC9063597.1 hypothetical protein [Flavobacterium sp. F-30]